MLHAMTLPETFPFAVALGLMLGIALLEGVSTLLGAGLSSLFDALLPEFDLDVELDVDSGIDATGSADSVGGTDAIVAVRMGFLSQTLSWLQFGRVPALILLILFLMAFGLIGLIGQLILRDTLGFLAPAWLASIPACLLALPCVRTLGGGIAHILPKEETAAVSSQSFVGRTAQIVLGTAREGAPAQARLRDQHGRSHYVMVEPDVAGETFGQGDPVLLVRADGPRFRIIRPPSQALIEPAHPGESH